jgi:hypothetical protein
MCRKIQLLLSCLFLFQAISAARLQAASGSGNPRIDIGPYVSTISYDEPGIMNESGYMYGVQSALVWHGRRYANLFDSIRLEGVAGRGKVDYTSSQSGSMNGVNNTMYEARAIFGREFSRKASATYASYTGFGYRFLSDRTGGIISSEGYHGYDRESRYLYLPVGVSVASRMERGWLFDGSIEYDLFLKGIQDSHLSQASSSVYTYRDDVTNDQHTGYGLKVALRFTKLMRGGGRLAIEPFLNYWDIGTSRSSTYTRIRNADASTALLKVWEPANRSTELGMKVLLLF